MDYSLVFAREEYTRLLAAALQPPYLVVTGPSEFAAAVAKYRPLVAYVDLDLLPLIESDKSRVKVIAISDGTLATLVRSLQTFPWLSHQISAASLSAPVVRSSLAKVRERIARGPEQPALTGVGRVALLTSSPRRDARLERLRDFFATHSVLARTTAALSDVAEELMTNALYNAPVEAGFFRSPIERTVDVELPTAHACEISYGIDEESVFVRVRDPFGAFTRRRMVDVLDRCNRKGVALDETRGGAGLGLWRVFSLASTITISVIPGRLTDVIVWIEGKKARSVGKLIHAVQLFFSEHSLDGAPSRFAADHDQDLIDDSFTAVLS
jgi:hypothetical protein